MAQPALPIIVSMLEIEPYAGRRNNVLDFLRYMDFTYVVHELVYWLVHVLGKSRVVELIMKHVLD